MASVGETNPPLNLVNVRGKITDLNILGTTKIEFSDAKTIIQGELWIKTAHVNNLRTNTPVRLTINVISGEEYNG